MSDAEAQMIQILTEMRDDQREENAHRRKIMLESVALQRRATFVQFLAVLFGFGMIVLGVILTLSRSSNPWG